jgi:hypothetical protein
VKQEYKVIQSFAATEPISGNQKKFAPGETLVCDKAEEGPTLTLEVGGGLTSYFLVERSVFEAC